LQLECVRNFDKLVIETSRSEIILNKENMNEISHGNHQTIQT
jgi:hypothetical protein